MAIVSYKITIGSKTIESPEKTTLKEVSVHSDLSTPVCHAEIILAQSEAVSYKTGDPLKVELGYNSKLKTVFTGIVQSVDYATTEVTISGSSAAEVLTRTHLDAVFENKDCGAIVKDLAGKYDVQLGTSEKGITFPRYIASSNRSIWKNIKQLAKYNGFDAYTDTEGKLNFSKYTKATTSPFSYSETILEIEKEEKDSLTDGVLVFGDSPAGQGQSDEANFWLKKTEVKGNAGKTSGTVPTLRVYAARNQDLCKSIADNIFEFSKVKATGRVLVINGNELELGKTISIKKMPNSAINGDYKVTDIHHRLNSDSGYTTEIMWEERE